MKRLLFRTLIIFVMLIGIMGIFFHTAVLSFDYRISKIELIMNDIKRSDSLDVISKDMAKVQKLMPKYYWFLPYVQNDINYYNEFYQNISDRASNAKNLKLRLGTDIAGNDNYEKIVFPQVVQTIKQELERVDWMPSKLETSNSINIFGIVCCSFAFISTSLALYSLRISKTE